MNVKKKISYVGMFALAVAVGVFVGSGIAEASRTWV